MKIQVLEREFVYHGTSLGDPDPKLSIAEVARMSGRTRRKPGPRADAFGASTRRPTLAGLRYLAAATGLISIAKLQPTHGGGKIWLGPSSLTALAQSLVELGFTTRADWTDAVRVFSTMVDRVLRRFLANNGQALIAEHFELSLMLGESIIDSAYGEAEPAASDQLFFVLNTESSFPLSVGRTIDELESVADGLAISDSRRTISTSSTSKSGMARK
jgi:hypothetical protein